MGYNIGNKHLHISVTTGVILGKDKCLLREGLKHAGWAGCVLGRGGMGEIYLVRPLVVFCNLQDNDTGHIWAQRKSHSSHREN